MTLSPPPPPLPNGIQHRPWGCISLFKFQSQLLDSSIVKDKAHIPPALRGSLCTCRTYLMIPFYQKPRDHLWDATSRHVLANPSDGFSEVCAYQSCGRDTGSCFICSPVSRSSVSGVLRPNVQETKGGKGGFPAARRRLLLSGWECQGNSFWSE